MKMENTTKFKQGKSFQCNSEPGFLSCENYIFIYPELSVRTWNPLNSLPSAFSLFKKLDFSFGKPHYNYIKPHSKEYCHDVLFVKLYSPLAFSTISFTRNKEEKNSLLKSSVKKTDFDHLFINRLHNED